MELPDEEKQQHDAQPRSGYVRLAVRELLSLIGDSRHVVTAFLCAGLLLGLFWVHQTSPWQTSVRITLHSPVAGYSERSFWDPATRNWVVRLTDAALKEQNSSGLQIFVSGTDPLNLLLSCSHRTQGAAAPVLQRVLKNASHADAESRKTSPEHSSESSSTSFGEAVKHSGNLRHRLERVDSELSRICGKFKVSRQRLELAGGISSIADTGESGNVPIETVAWYPWYNSLQREYSRIWSLVMEQPQDTPLRESIKADLSSIAEQLESASVLLVIAWKSTNTRNASNWPLEVWHGLPREELVLWRKRLLDPLLTGMFLGVLSAGTWIALKRWFLESVVDC